MNDDPAISDLDFQKICESIERYNNNQILNRLQDLNPHVSDIYSIIMKCICCELSMKNAYPDIYYDMSPSIQEKIDRCIAQSAGSDTSCIYRCVNESLNKLYLTTTFYDDNNQLRRVTSISTVDNKKIAIDLATYDRLVEAKDRFRNCRENIGVLRTSSRGINDFILANIED